MNEWSAIMAAGALAGAGGVALGARAMFSPRSSLLIPTISRGTDQPFRSVALTFDDGPHPDTTPRILDILRAESVIATFFVIGVHALHHPDLVGRMHEEDHLIGNHSHHHHYSGTFGRVVYWQRELESADRAIEAVIHRRSLLFRPPMGFRSVPMARALRRSGHSVITWTRSARDGVTTSAERILERLADRAAPADILLLHDGAAPRSGGNREATVAALPRLIARLRDRGLSIAPLDRLIQRPAYR